MAFFVNPYNFIPFGGTVDEKRSDRKEVYRGSDPLKSGWIDVSLIVKTPLIIPDGAHPVYVDKNTGKEFHSNTLSDAEKKTMHKKYSFNRIAEGNENVPVIPGSELRGMIRSVYEAATDSCLPFLLNDKPISQRVPTFGSLQRRGLLSFEKNEHGIKRWVLYRTRADKEKVYFQNGRLKRKSDDKDITHLRPGMINQQGCVLQYNYPVATNKPYHIAYLEKSEIEHEWEPGDDYAYKSLKSSLDRDGARGPNKANRIPNAALRTLLEEAKKDRKMVPVWYFKVHSPEGDIVYLSGSSIGRIAQRRKWKDIVGDYAPCSDVSKLCPACMLFGTVYGEGMKGHVHFSDALPVSPVKTEWHTLQVLGEPRPSAFEFYLKKPGNATYWNFDFYGTKRVIDFKTDKFITEYHHLEQAEPRGRKMYWHGRPVADDTQRNHINSTMESVSEGSFSFRIYYDQITEKQLKDLLWIISLGDNRANSNMQHKLGHAKPLGYGSVKLLVDSYTIRCIQDSENSLKYTIDVHEYEGSKPSFNMNSDTMKALCSMADASKTIDMNVMYPRFIKINKRTGASDDSIYQWFSNNHMKPDRLVTLPLPDDKNICLSGSWKPENDPYRDNNRTNTFSEDKKNTLSKPVSEETSVLAIVHCITDAGHILLKRAPDLKPNARINKKDVRGEKLKEGDRIKVKFENSYTYDNGKTVNNYIIVKK